MKPPWKSRKFWTAIVSLVAMLVAYFTGRPDLADKLVAVGGMLLLGLAAEDHGKAAAAMASPPEDP